MSLTTHPAPAPGPLPDRNGTDPAEGCPSPPSDTSMKKVPSERSAGTFCSSR